MMEIITLLKSLYRIWLRKQDFSKSRLRIWGTHLVWEDPASLIPSDMLLQRSLFAPHLIKMSILRLSMLLIFLDLIARVSPRPTKSITRKQLTRWHFSQALDTLMRIPSLCRYFLVTLQRPSLGMILKIARCMPTTRMGMSKYQRKQTA